MSCVDITLCRLSLEKKIFKLIAGKFLQVRLH